MLRKITKYTNVLAARLLVCLVTTNICAAELEVRSTARCDGRILHLGDVCEIHAANEKIHQELEAIELGPAPQQGSNVTIRARDIQDRLSTLGINLIEHRFTGSSSVTINNATPLKQAKPLLTPTQINAVQASVIRLVQSQLLANQRMASNRQTNRASDLRKQNELQREVMPELTDEQIAFLAPRLTQLQVASEIDPNKTEQNVVLRTGGRDPQDVTIKITLQQAAQVVVVTRNVPRGVVLTSYDVELQPANNSNKNSSYSSLEEVVGRESTVSIAPGQVLDPQYVRSPLVVRRGEVVDVVVRSGGIHVHTKARARGDGGVGDVVQVDLLHNKESFVSRVSGPQTVEVLGSADH